MAVTWLDVVIVAIVALSALFGVVRGFVREMLSLIAWVLSFWLASRYADAATVYLEGWIPYQDARLVTAFVALFFAVLIVGMVVGRLIGKLMRASGIGGDRALGAGFGLLRGVVIVAVLVTATAITPLADDAAWRQSLLTGYFESLAGGAFDALKERGLGVEEWWPGAERQ